MALAVSANDVLVLKRISRFLYLLRKLYSAIFKQGGQSLKSFWRMAVLQICNLVAAIANAWRLRAVV